MNMQQKFAEKKERAEQEIKSMLWQDSDNDDEVITIANGAGIAATEVQEWSDQIEGAKEQLAEVANVDLDALRQDAKSKQTAAKSAASKAERANEIRNQKQQAADAARRELRDAEMGLRDLTNELFKIGTPQAQIPSQCQKIHAFDLASERRDEQRSIVRKHGKNVKAFEEQLEALAQRLDGDHEKTKSGEVTLRGVDLIPIGEATESRRKAVESRLQQAQKNADDATKVLQRLQSEVESARQEAGL